mgnify:CR=1 FL=1
MNNTISKDDQDLSAYLDGELPPDEADALSERLAREPALMQRLEAMRAADARTRDAYAALDATPMPQAVLDLLGQAPASVPADNVVAFPQRGIRSFFQLPVALAASVALLAGFLANSLWQNAAAPGGEAVYVAAIAADSDLYELLEHQQSGAALSFANGETGQATLTFVDRAGDYCRQVQVRGADATTYGVACRRNGNWRLETLSYGAAADSSAPFGQAAESVPAAVTSAVENLIGAGDTLEKDQEIALISNAWKKTENNTE